LFVGGQQRCDFAAQGLIRAANLGEKPGAPRRLALERCLVQLANLFVPFGSHESSGGWLVTSDE